MEKRQAELNKYIKNLVLAIERGQNIDLINDRLMQNREELQEIETELEIERNKIINLSEEQIKFFLSHLRSGQINDIKYRKTLVNIFINRIYLFDDRINIIFNVDDNPLIINNYNAILKDIKNNKLNDPSLYLTNLGSPKKPCGNTRFFDI